MNTSEFADKASKQERGFKAPAEMSVQKRTYYQILGIKKGASEEDINNAFKKLAGRLHPDRPENKGREEEFIQLTNARDFLLDPQKRANYDGRTSSNMKTRGEVFSEGIDEDEWMLESRTRDAERKSVESFISFAARDKNGKIAERSKSMIGRLIKFIKGDDTVAYAEELKKMIDQDHDSAKILDRMLTDYEQKYEQAHTELIEFIKGPDARNSKQLLPLLRSYGMNRLDIFCFKKNFLGSTSKDLVLNMISKNARLEDYARAALEFEGIELK